MPFCFTLFRLIQLKCHFDSPFDSVGYTVSFCCSFATLLLLFIHVFLFVVSRIHFPFFTHLLLAIEDDNDEIEKSYSWRSRHTWSIFGNSDSSILSEDINHFLEKKPTLDFARKTVGSRSASRAAHCRLRFL